MTSIHDELITIYTADKMFAVVVNVKDYPQFLPYCKSSHILSQDNENLQIKLVLAKGVFQKPFTLHYHLQKDRLIEVKLIEGPFKQLYGYWDFEPVAQGCKFTLHLEYAFANKLTSLAYSRLFDPIANTLAKTFYQRAAMVYGKLK